MSEIHSLIISLEELNKKLLKEHKKAKAKISELIHEKSVLQEEQRKMQMFLSQIVHSIANSLTILRLNLEDSCNNINNKSARIFRDEIA